MMEATNVYLTYEAYQSYGGTLGEADFNRAEFRARKRIDELTDGRVQAMAAVPEAVKLAMMSIIRADGAVGADAQAGSPPVAAFATDGYSERYAAPAERTAALEKQLNAEIRRLLTGETDDEGVGLVYKGIR